jgi:uncharacterized linocin/CFP29 family protein
MSEYTALIDRDYEAIAFELLKIIREPLVWTSKMPAKNVGGYGVQDYTWHAVKDVRDPMIGMDAISYDYDQALVTPTTQQIPVIWKDIDVEPRTLAASQRGPIEDVSLRSQKAETEKLIDYVERTLVIGFDSPFAQTAINEQITDSGNSAGAWSTAANIETDAKAVYASLMSAGFYGPYSTIIDSVLAGDVQSLVANTGTTYLDYINRLFTQGASFTNYQGTTGGVMNTTAGTFTALESATRGQNNFEMLIAENWRTHDASAAKGHFGLRLKIYGAMTHEVYRGSAGAVIDAITA